MYNEIINDMEKDIYTFDELKKRVNDLKVYATKLSSELNVEFSIEVYSEAKDFGYGKEYKASSSIKIID